ncbi:hypothetical protein [Paraburkholderia sp. BL10I2N1]|uniref:hypothetical protein n=1 Tax=Paraburkholderia sp. BL10I2N1 TaxID=1938796 RepID=UPI0014151028|nr:hypothetical protein [Paraburkholderia sp. BL10I2N1]
MNRVVKEGRGRHSEYLYPAMPYTAIVKISDQDVRDVKACLYRAGRALFRRSC